MADRTDHGIEWCRRCKKHQALSAHDGICPVCDPDRSQATEVQKRAQAALDAIDNALTPPSRTPDDLAYVEWSADVDYQPSTTFAAFAAMRTVASRIGDVPEASGEPQITTHDVHRVGTPHRVSAVLWLEQRENVLDMLVDELVHHARRQGEWLIGSPHFKIYSVYFGRVRPVPRRWWHRLAFGLWKPSGIVRDDDRVVEGEHNGVHAYEVRMYGYSVDLPPEHHPSPEIWRNGSRAFRALRERTLGNPPREDWRR